MYQTKIFKTRNAFVKWVKQNGHKNQWNEIFVNNAYGVEFKPLRKILK